jgi:glutathione S-transferase
MLDGLAVWNREIVRPEVERSATVIEHEAQRSRRMADVWEKEIDHPLMRGKINMAQLTLACALGLDARIPEFHWRPGHPKICAWYDPIAARPSFAATAPPRA